MPANLTDIKTHKVAQQKHINTNVCNFKSVCCNEKNTNYELLGGK